MKELRGYIYKRSGTILWKVKRYYVLKEGILDYYETELDYLTKKNHRGFYNLNEYDLKFDVEKFYIALYPKADGP